MLGPSMSAVPSNVGGYSVTSSLLCCHLQCKGFVFCPGLSQVRMVIVLLV